MPGEPQKLLDVRSQEHKLLGIQILRGLAAFAVLVHHSLEETQGLWPSGPRNQALVLVGAAGVDIFFVISGFIMLHSTWHRFGEQGAAADFVVRRIIRIVPLYWICSLLVVALAATGAFYRSQTITFERLLSSLTFLPTHEPIHGVGWTLQYEMYFYGLFAAALACLSRRQAIMTLPAVLTAVILTSQFLPPGPTQRFLANPIALEFAYGIGIACLFRWRTRMGIPPSVLIFAGLTGMVTSAYWAPSSGTAGLMPSVRFIAWGIPAALIVLAATTVYSAKGTLDRLLLKLGDMSFSLYLTHAFVMTAYARLIGTTALGQLLGPLAALALAIGVSIVVAQIVYVYVERPITNWLRAEWGAHSGAARPLRSS
jgi:peptidoglycan/LPS O-acetylase OafA/YrhL